MATVHPDPIGRFRDSWRNVYRLFLPRPRTIDRPIDCGKEERCRSFEQVHPTARQRLDRADECRPVYVSASLDAYLVRQEEGEAGLPEVREAEAARG
jgi:hypothetical protein